MNLNSQKLDVPFRLETSEFVIYRQRISDNQLDYLAVMNSKETLREWSDSEWPEDDFTLEQNAEDIAGHIADHERNEDYGFSIFLPNENQLLGSLYFNAVEPLLENDPTDPETLARLLEFDVRVEYWLRTGTSPELEKQFVRSVLAWLEQSWWFKNPVFGSRRNMISRRKLYAELGMTEVVALTSKNGKRKFHFHQPEPVRR
jgi:RimJ/RimL family protein N-acetyltransferase